MYGIIFKTIQEAVLDTFDENTWNKIISNTGIENTIFLSTEDYDDELFYRLVVSAEEILKLDQEQILEIVGRYWICSTAKTKYLDLMKSGGNDLKEFLINLPFLHNRIIILYPKIADFDFEVSRADDKDLIIRYITGRKKLEFFLLGALKGLAEFYSEEVTVELLESKDISSKISLFKITWV